MGRHSLNGAAGIAPVWLPVLAITAVVTSPYAPTPPFPCGRFLWSLWDQPDGLSCGGKSFAERLPGCTI